MLIIYTVFEEFIINLFHVETQQQIERRVIKRLMEGLLCPYRYLLELIVYKLTYVIYVLELPSFLFNILKIQFLLL